MRAPAARRRRGKRVERTGLELLWLMLVMVVSATGALAQSRVGGTSWEIAPIAATVTVSAPSQALPAGLGEEEISVNQLEPLPLRDLVGRIADLVGVEAAIEERPGRVLDGDLALEAPVPFGLSMTGSLPAVLDEVARLSGYDWGWEGDRILFYRYGDIEQRRPERVPGGVVVGVLAAVAGGEKKEACEAEAQSSPGCVASEVSGEPEPGDGAVASDAAEAVEPGDRVVVSDAAEAVEGRAESAAESEERTEPVGWTVDPETHGTVEEVLRAWAERAGWQLGWKSERRFRIGAEAEFPAGETVEAGFLAAADALLAIGPMRRALSATAYPNRWLVIQDVGSVVQ